jgi:hypothetical protein
MDYQLFQESLLTGDQVRHWNSALEYDYKAIQNLYFSRPLSDMPLFCTDSHLGKYVDCSTFDFGPSVFEFAKISEEKAFQNLPYTLMERFISAKSRPNGEASLRLSKALQSSIAFAVEAMKPRLKLLKALTEDARFLKAGRGMTGDDNTAYLTEEIMKGGGLNAFLSPSRLENIKTAETVFLQLLDSEIYTRGEGAGGSYEFTDEDKVIMKRAARLFFSNLPSAIKPAELILYKAPMKFHDEAFGSELANIFAERAAYVLEGSMGTLSAEVPGPDGVKRTLAVPRFFFSNELRQDAASILNKRSENPAWGYKAKAALKKRFVKMIDTSFKDLDFSKIDISEFPDDLLSWVLINRQILDVLTPGYISKEKT